VIQLWFVLPNGSKVAGAVHQMPRRGDVVRLEDDGAAYEVMQIEHIATPQGKSRGIRYTQIIVRLTEWGRPADPEGR
jgi:hypothetical protein